MLLAGGIAAAISLSVNSLGNQGWTVAVLAAMGWLILGLVSSPLLMRNLSRPVAQAQRDNEQSVDAPEAEHLIHEEDYSREV